MKKIIIALTLFISSSLFCQYIDRDYEVDFKELKKFFSFTVRTVEDRPEMGALVINNLQISMPVDNVPGTISMELILNPKKAHLPAFGQQAGEFTFYKGNRLPQIMDGQYEIVIDGISYGHLLIDQNDGSYYPLEKSFNR